MGSYDPADSLHRLAKQALDNGSATSIEEAEAILRRYEIAFAIDRAAACDPLHQAALVTAVALACRVFLGGVTVGGELDVPLTAPLPLGETLAEAVASLGGSPAAPSPSTPLVSIGGPPQPRGSGFHIRTVFGGWRGGIVPADSEACPIPGSPMPLAAMLSAALAVNEAYLHANGETRAAGRRAVGLSLWNPSPELDWVGTSEGEPDLRYLPSGLWLIGLGHLGQAYLWGLGLLPYADPSGLSLVLQDVDRITPSSMSTSILTDSEMVGMMKTRAMAAWAERRGFKTAVHERRFDGSFRRQDSEPTVALCGIDNALGRRALDQVGFEFVVEAGLGRGHRDFRSIRLHTLPGPRAAGDLWKGTDRVEDFSGSVAYQRMLRHGELDRCGVTLLAGKAVGAPFVGSIASCLVLSEVLRLLHEGPLHHVIEMDLRSAEYRSAIVRPHAMGTFNPGYVLAK